MRNIRVRVIPVLILSGISLTFALIWMILCFMMPSSWMVFWRRAVLLGLSVLFFFLSIYGFRHYWKLSREEEKKPTKTIAVILGVLVVVLVTIISHLPSAYHSLRLNATLRPYVQEEFTSYNAELPADPWFVFYDKGNFLVPPKHFLRGTDDPEKVNVIVAYEKTDHKTGIWVDKNSGEKLADARAQDATLYVIRLSDWALIKQVQFSQQLDYMDRDINIPGMNQVIEYLNEMAKDE